MAEILATMVVGPLVSMVNEKASSYLLEQYRVMEGMEEQHEVLKRKLPAILDVITDAEMQAAKHREGAKAWLEAVRKVAYQANDILDEFKYEALRRKAKKEGHYCKLGMHVIKLFPTHNRIAFCYRMRNKLRMILQAIEILIAEMNAFHFKFRPQQQLSMKWRQTDSEIHDPKKIVSRSRVKETKKVIATLIHQGSNKDLIVLPIVGMGGLGKTTLAQLVYNDIEIQKHFQLLLWVCVSDNFDVDFLAKSIVEAATKEKETSFERENKSPLDNLRKVVSGKRYLLVLDDVWNRNAHQWEKLKSCLQYGGTGSAVLTTTRDKAIAEFMGTTEALKLGLLDKSFIEEIIEAKAFSSENRSSFNNLVKMVGAMADKCSGSPLAATALGSVLRTKSSVQEWKAVLSRSTICDDETGILPILKLSYNDLPPQMRQCFSFCAMFPKDYEIDVDILIQLWIANGFILEEHPEIRGRKIFDELLSKSFFQDITEIPFCHSDLFKASNQYCSRITCKIHDLMHDVAKEAMGKECASMVVKPSKMEDFPYSSRHLFVSLNDPESILNGCLEERSPALQTLLCTGYRFKNEELQYLSKYNTVRALRIGGQPSLKPKYLHHLRYLDLSRSRIDALPEDVSILYHLQTLNVSYCRFLTRLPKEMKFMTALRHFYTHGCENLKMMPPELRRLASLQTLTCFVAGTINSSCSNLGELGPLDLDGHLEVLQLENVTEIDAQAAKFGDKKRLTGLTLKWKVPCSMEPQHHEKVLECLKPHDEIKVLRIYSYRGSTYPAAWIDTLQHMVELVLRDCNKLEKLPPLWQLPALQFLCVSGPKNVHCFCDGDRPPFTFKKLKELVLGDMPNLEAWWEIKEVQGQDPMFPEVEKLSIGNCGKLLSLPSPFPALKELELYYLRAFQRWEEAAVDNGTLGEQMTTFPCLEKLLIIESPELTTLPEAPKLSVLEVYGDIQQIFFHVARYTTSLSTLIFSLYKRERTLPTDPCLTKLVDDKEKWSHEFVALRVARLFRCDFLFPQLSAPPAALWNCLTQLEYLRISVCDALVHWPENVFRCLVSLRKLRIEWCDQLTGRREQDSAEQSTTIPGQSIFPPRLESLVLRDCESLVDVPTLPASLRELRIDRCRGLESVILGKEQQDSSSTSARLVASGDGVVIRQEKSAPLQGSCSSEAPNLSSSSLPPSASQCSVVIVQCSNLQSLSIQLDCTELVIRTCDRLKSLDGDHLTASLESLDLEDCKSLESIPDGGPQAYSSLRYLEIRRCPRLKVLPPCMTSLERLYLFNCKSLESIPDGGPQAYSSLRYLRICSCPRLKVLPPCLKQRLNDIEKTYLDARYTGPKLSRPSTWKYAMSRHC